MEEKIKQKIFSLKNINWDFHSKGVLSIDDKKPFDSRKFHWYPATYIPEIPYSLIEILTEENDIVYDPFAGIGTTFFQALILNRQPITSDSNSVSINYIKSLVDVVINDNNLTRLGQNIIEKINDFKTENSYFEYLSEEKYLNLSPWFEKNALNELSYLYNIYTESEGSVKKIIYILISGLMKSSCSQQRGWGYIADNVKPKEDQFLYKNIIDTFLKKLLLLLNELKIVQSNMATNQKFKNSLTETIFQHDVVESISIPKNTVDLIVTSPPYPNMIDYSKSQRLLYYLFDYDMKEDLTKEIGARAFRNRKYAIDNYIDKMKIAFINIAKVLKVNGLICLILPYYDNIKNENNLRRQQAINILIEWFEENGFEKEHTILRTISHTKRNQNTALASLVREQIVVFRKIK